MNRRVFTVVATYNTPVSGGDYIASGTRAAIEGIVENLISEWLCEVPRKVTLLVCEDRAL